MDITQNKVSNFFTSQDTVTNELAVVQSYMQDKRVMYNVNFAAARLDLIKFSINADIEIVNWWMSPEVMKRTNMFEFSPHAKGLAVEFKVTSRISTRYAYEIIKNKILGKNSITLSLHELIFNEAKDTVYISFKTNIEMEKNKIGIMKKGIGRFYWSYMDKKKIEVRVNPTKTPRQVTKGYTPRVMK